MQRIWYKNIIIWLIVYYCDCPRVWNTVCKRACVDS
jgi:hypothetical protein